MASPAKVRNIGVIAHIDAGKTTFTERMLFYSGVTHRMGEVHDGDAQMDYLPQERERGITIVAAVTHFPWAGADIHLIDTPGHVDFTIEVERSLRVLDGAIAVFCGVAGVEPQSEVVWRQATRHAVPRLAFVNKLDRPGADFDRVVAQMADKLSARGVPVTAPLFEGDAFRAVADLVTMERIDFDEKSQGADVARSPLSVGELQAVFAWREALVEAAADFDDAVADKYLAGEDIPVALLRGAIRKGTLASRIFPVYAGSALRNRGVQPAMDGIVHYLPAPHEAPPVEGIDPRGGGRVTRQPSPGAPFSALVFKVVMEEGRRTVYLRVYSGTLSEGDTLLNAATGAEEKVSRLFSMHAGKKERIEKASAGDIVAARGIRSAGTGDTLCAPSAPLLLESIDVRKPVVSIVVEPKTMREMERMKELLGQMADEDPTVGVREDADTGQMILSGMGELHLEVLLDRLRREHGLEVRTGNPQVLCRETVAQAAEGEARFEHEIAERLVGVTVALSVLPGARGSGVTVVDPSALPGILPDVAAAVEGGIREGLYSGVSGYPVDDVIVEVGRVEFFAGPPTPQAAKVAAARAFFETFGKGRPYLLEPVMSVEINVPDEFSGGVIGDLNARRGHLASVDRQPGATVLSVKVPLREMFGYATALRSLTQGRATFAMTFSHFDRA
jgi:elongation factor G